MFEVSKLNSLVKTCLNGLSQRQKEVLEGRYGLTGANAQTLAELGSKYSLTRERVRQIEALALKNCKAKMDGSEGAEFAKAVGAILKNTGGLKREDLIINELGGNFNKVKFLLEVSGKFNYSKEDNNFHAYWYLNDSDQKKLTSFVNYLVKNSSRDNFSSAFASAAKNHNLSDSVSNNYALVSKKVSANIYGELGLSDWPEINPKTARDWSYLVLKKEQKPLHFTTIAKLVSGLRKKAAHAPTIHNELIKDAKFVLVGKGTYSLKEFGVIPGTAREIISHFIAKNGPLKANAIIDLVLKERLFKENTILINLQNRKNFKRLNDGRYTTLA